VIRKERKMLLKKKRPGKTGGEDDRGLELIVLSLCDTRGKRGRKIF